MRSPSRTLGRFRAVGRSRNRRVAVVRSRPPNRQPWRAASMARTFAFTARRRVARHRNGDQPQLHGGLVLATNSAAKQAAGGTMVEVRSIATSRMLGTRTMRVATAGVGGPAWRIAAMMPSRGGAVARLRYARARRAADPGGVAPAAQPPPGQWSVRLLERRADRSEPGNVPAGSLIAPSAPIVPAAAPGPAV